jgi:hypothetical protein
MKMPEHEFLKEKNVLIITPSLIYRSQNSIEALKEIIDLIVKYGYPNVLGDFRDLEINFSMLSAIEKPKQWKLLGVSRNIKIAALFDKLEDGKTLRINTLFSHGFKVSAFTDYNKAIEWLLE